MKEYEEQLKRMLTYRVNVYTAHTSISGRLEEFEGRYGVRVKNDANGYFASTYFGVDDICELHHRDIHLV